MSIWHPVNARLPKLGVPVLCIVRAACECDHYVPTILCRQMLHDGWAWMQDVNCEFIHINEEKVVAWRSIEKFPTKFAEGFYR